MKQKKTKTKPVSVAVEANTNSVEAKPIHVIAKLFPVSQTINCLSWMNIGQKAKQTLFDSSKEHQPVNYFRFLPKHQFVNYSIVFARQQMETEIDKSKITKTFGFF